MVLTAEVLAEGVKSAAPRLRAPLCRRDAEQPLAPDGPRRGREPQVSASVRRDSVERIGDE